MERTWDACGSLDGQLLLSAVGSLWCWGGAQTGSRSAWRVLMAGAAGIGAGGDPALCLCCSKGFLAVVAAVSPWEEPLGAPNLWLH